MTPQQIDAMKLALEALENYAWHEEACPQHPTYSEPENYPKCTCGYDQAITALQEALKEHAMRETQRLGQEMEQKPVAWLLTDKNINSLQVDSIQRLIDRLKHAHHTDLCVRINGQDEWFEADWLKHMVRAAPPKRKPLTDEEMKKIWYAMQNIMGWYLFQEIARAIEAAHDIKENT